MRNVENGDGVCVTSVHSAKVVGCFATDVTGEIKLQKRKRDIDHISDADGNEDGNPVFFRSPFHNAL